MYHINGYTKRAHKHKELGSASLSSLILLHSQAGINPHNHSFASIGWHSTGCSLHYNRQLSGNAQGKLHSSTNHRCCSPDVIPAALTALLNDQLCVIENKATHDQQAEVKLNLARSKRETQNKQFITILFHSHKHMSLPLFFRGSMLRFSAFV